MYQYIIAIWLFQELYLKSLVVVDAFVHYPFWGVDKLSGVAACVEYNTNNMYKVFQKFIIR